MLYCCGDVIACFRWKGRGGERGICAALNIKWLSSNVSSLMRKAPLEKKKDKKGSKFENTIGTIAPRLSLCVYLDDATLSYANV